MTLKRRTSHSIMASVLFALVLREMRGRFGDTRLGGFWLLGEPVLQIGLMVFLFSFRQGLLVGGLEYPVFLLTGMIPFFAMRNIALKGMEAVSANKALFAYKQITPFDTIFARTITETVIHACVYIILLFIFAFFFGFDIVHHDPIRWIIVMFIGLTMSFALGILYCLLGEVLPDAKYIIKLIYFPLYLASGVVFPIHVLPDSTLIYFLWNPYVHILEELRGAFFMAYPITHGVSVTYPAILTSVLLFLALGLYRIQRLRLTAL